MRSSRQVGLAAAVVAIALQWFIVAGFVAHAFTWWVKIGDTGAVTAGFTGTVLFFIGSAVAAAYAFCDYARDQAAGPESQRLALLVGLAGLAGLLVFSGMVFTGIVLIVQR